MNIFVEVSDEEYVEPETADAGEQPPAPPDEPWSPPPAAEPDDES